MSGSYRVAVNRPIHLIKPETRMNIMVNEAKIRDTHPENITLYYRNTSGIGPKQCNDCGECGKPPDKDDK